jgi:hypothetical protein
MAPIIAGIIAAIVGAWIIIFRVLPAKPASREGELSAKRPEENE